MSPRQRPPQAAEKGRTAAAPSAAPPRQNETRSEARMRADEEEERARIERTARYLKGPTAFSA